VLTMGGRCGQVAKGNRGVAVVLDGKAVGAKRRGNGGNCLGSHGHVRSDPAPPLERQPT
jgi:hypothetical protein